VLPPPVPPVPPPPPPPHVAQIGETAESKISDEAIRRETVVFIGTLLPFVWLGRQRELIRKDLGYWTCRAIRCAGNSERGLSNKTLSFQKAFYITRAANRGSRHEQDAGAADVFDQIFLVRVNSCDFVDRFLATNKRSTKSHELTRTKKDC
jgi:hypothetical protein